MTALVPAAPGTGEIADRDMAIAAAVNALRAVPRGGGRYGPRPLTELWLRGHAQRSRHTAKAYRLALTAWDEYCHRNDLDPMAARPADLTDWLHRDAVLRGWRSDSTLNMKLSVVSDWYGFLIRNRACEYNPAAGVDRPRVDQDATATPGLDSGHVGVLLDHLRDRAENATADTAEVRCRDYALVWLMLATAARSGGVAHALRSQLGHERGHRVLRFHSKGKTHVVPVDPGTGAALNCYLQARDERGVTAPDTRCPGCAELLGDHLFLTTPWRNHRGGRPLSADELGQLLRRHAHNAGVPGAHKLVPHSLRHAAITAALDEGVTLARAQDMAGHADPRTTRRYDHNRDRLDQSAVYDLARRWSRFRNHHSEDQTP